MSEILIEKYRGWDILFDTNSEGFYVESDHWDQRKDKRTYSSCKTYVDEYLKLNNEFKPIKIQHIHSGDIRILTGVRKDGRFTYEEDGVKKQLSDYDLDSWMKFNPANQDKYKAIEGVESEFDDLRKSIAEIRKTIVGDSLKELKKTNQI